jgi:hypothetical protein
MFKDCDDCPSNWANDFLAAIENLGERPRSMQAPAANQKLDDRETMRNAVLGH